MEKAWGKQVWPGAKQGRRALAVQGFQGAGARPGAQAEPETPQGQASLSPSYRHHDHSAWETADPIHARDAWEASRALREDERHRGMEIERWSKR